ncbi:hypothetical protein GCM10025768_18610 [Microbacterium pseudoresistens]
MEDLDHKYWYNTRTDEVEYGMIAPAPDRLGPFDTAEEAARAPQKIDERARAWATEEALEDDWGAAPGTSARGTEGRDGA